MVVAAVFHGTAAQTRVLMTAIERNCSCENKDGMTSGNCPAHRSLLDQRFLDGLLFALKLRAKLEAQEKRVRR